MIVRANWRLNSAKRPAAILHDNHPDATCTPPYEGTLYLAVLLSMCRYVSALKFVTTGLLSLLI